MSQNSVFHHPGPSSTQILEQLKRILNSQRIVESPRLGEFLQYVVKQTLAGQAGRIKGYTIAQEVFGRNDPEEAQTSTIVRVEAGRLRRRLADYYAEEGKDDPVHIVIPKGTYVPSFELTSLHENNTPPPLPEISQQRNRYILPVSLIAVISILVAIIAFLPINLYPTTNPTLSNTQLTKSKPATTTLFGRPSIVVLPFHDSTDENNQALLAEGLTEDIITDLSKLSGINVIAYPSVLPYQQTAFNPLQIRNDLGVAYVLRGSIRGTADNIRITAQLYVTETGNQVWAQRFDRKVDDILNLQDELAIKIVQGMSVNLHAQETQRIQNRYRKNIEVYSLYKQAMALVNPPSDPARLKIARNIFQRLIEIAPTFPGGYAGTAYTYAFDVWWGHSKEPAEDIRKAFNLADKATQIDPFFGLSYSALAYAHLTQRDFDNALTASENAIKAQPNNPYVLAYHGYMLAANGEAKRGIKYAQQAIRLDPLSTRTPYLNILGVLYFHSGLYQNALEAFDKNIQQEGPANPVIQAYHAATFFSLGQKDKANNILNRLNDNQDNFDWQSWIRRSFKNQKDVDLVLNSFK